MGVDIVFDHLVIDVGDAKEHRHRLHQAVAVTADRDLDAGQCRDIAVSRTVHDHVGRLHVQAALRGANQTADARQTVRRPAP